MPVSTTQVSIAASAGDASASIATMRSWGKRAAAVLAALTVTAAVVGPLPVRAAGPSQLPPNVHLQALGTLGAKSLPLRVAWPAAVPQGSAINHYELQMSRDNGAWTNVALPRLLTRSVVVNQPAWGELAFRVRAVDNAARPSDWAESDPLWPSTAQESDRSVNLSAGWQIVSRAAAFGGRRAVTTQGAATVTYAFTGREVGWVARLGPSAGTAEVTVDGGPAVDVSLKRTKSTNRRLVVTRSWSSVGQHTLTVTTKTAGASYDVDAFVVIGNADDATLVGAGDIASCTSTKDSATAAAAAGVPGIVFTAGDNVYPDGAPTNYTNCYDPSWGTLKDRTMPVPGNHDYENNPGAPGYFGYFGAAAGDAQKGWYKYDAGTWRVYALNSECTSTTCPQQYDWLKGDLAAEPHLCTLAIWHRPRFSTGPHGNNPRLDDVWKLLYANGAEVVLNGHDHMFERYVPLDGAGTPKGNGLREFVVGTGGASLYAYKTVSDNIAV